MELTEVAPGLLRRIQANISPKIIPLKPVHCFTIFTAVGVFTRRTICGESALENKPLAEHGGCSAVTAEKPGPF